MEYLNKAFLLIGGNVGDRISNIEIAVKQLQVRCGNVVARSAIYKTAPWGNTNQPAFLNQAIELHTSLTSLELLFQLLEIEKEMGRIRKERYGPRIIDLDIIFFNDEVYDSKALTIPHKEMQNRRFVLQPLSEIASGFIHPVLQKSVLQLLQDCPDESDVIVND